jgi:hypothetical protein
MVAAASGKASAPVANVLDFATRVDIAAHLCDGCSVRATARLVRTKDRPDGVHKNTVLDFLVMLGDGCARLHDRLVRGVHASDVEMDEIWTFVHKKQARCLPTDPSEWGDNYTFVAMARSSKLVISYLTGPRDGTTAFVFAHDLKTRLVTTPGRVSLLPRVASSCRAMASCPTSRQSAPRSVSESITARW